MNKNLKWERALLSPTSLIKDAAEVLSDAALKIVLITDSNLKFIGTVTDGDIRRGLLRGLTLASPISAVINRNATTVPRSYEREGVLRLMLAKKIFQIPIVDEDSKLVGLHLWDEVITPAAHDNLMVIMAGGEGRRLLPKTEKVPKPMLLLGDKPILEHIIVRAKANGINRFVLAIHHLGEVIEEYFGDGLSLGVKISYIKESFPMGTAGALGLIDPIPTESIIVTNGDVITDINYSDILEFHTKNRASATIAIATHRWQNPYGVVKNAGIKYLGLNEKPILHFLINAGVYVLEPQAISTVKDHGFMNMTDLIEFLRQAESEVIVFPIYERWSDLGSHEDLNRIIKEFHD
jgi:dTDP-glucose pyrophosphorylase